MQPARPSAPPHDAATSAEEAGARADLAGRARQYLSHPLAPRIVIAIALLLVSTVLTLGPTADDYIHLLGVRDEPGIDGLRLRPWDLFAFAPGDVGAARALMDEGVFPWWSDPTTVIAFFRPLSSLTHWLDYSLWPERHALIHFHSLLWYGLLLVVVARAYRRLAAAPAVATLALALYALDDARAPAVGWVATRNLLIAVSFALLALDAHVRAHRDGHARSRLLAPVWLGIGLLGGESAVQVVAYIGAYALFVQGGSLRQRAASLVPYAAVLLVWRIPYSLLGHGARGSGLYFDPGREPLAFLEVLSERLPVLLVAQLGLPFSDLWDMLPIIAPGTQPLMMAWALLVITAVVALLLPLLRESPLARFWALGALLSAIPVCAGPLDDRLLIGPGIGACALLAQLFAAFAARRYPYRGRLATAGVAALALLHGVLSPLFLPLRAYSIDVFEGYMRAADENLPKGPGVRDLSIVAINPPVDLFAMYFPFYREANGIPRPKHFRWLATGVSDLTITRVDAHTLRIRPSAGFLSNSSQLMLRSLARPLRRGETIVLSDATITVTELTYDLRPLEVLVRFHDVLESPKLHFVQWGKQEYVRFTPPAVGQTVVVPRVDMQAAMLGSE